MSFNFYNIVLITAVIILILVLTYIGIQMYRKSTTDIFPPVVAACPDVWEQTPDGKYCRIPNASQSSLTAPGMDATNGTIDFKDPKWSVKQSAICAQREWANKNGIVWDGVSNYNGTC